MRVGGWGGEIEGLPILMARIGVLVDVAEPPKLYGLRAPVIILKTYDCCTRAR